MNLNFENKFNFVCNNKFVLVVVFLWLDIFDLDLEKMLCYFFLIFVVVLLGLIFMVVNEIVMFCYVWFFIFEVSDGFNFFFNICLFLLIRFVSVSVLLVF